MCREGESPAFASFASLLLFMVAVASFTVAAGGL
jgi:hypothetical protein